MDKSPMPGEYQMDKNCSFRKSALAAAVTAACMTAPVALQAQDEKSGLLDEIIVTAAG